MTDHIGTAAIDDDKAVMHPAFLLAQFQPAVLLLEIRRGLPINLLYAGGQDSNAYLRLFCAQQSEEAISEVRIANLYR